MEKRIIISEEEKNRILELYSETDEGVFDSIKNVYHGLRGAFHGHGYDYLKHVSEIRNISRDLKSKNESTHKSITKLNDLKTSIVTSKMPQNKKDVLIGYIDQATTHFDEYQKYIVDLEKGANYFIKTLQRPPALPTTPTPPTP